MAGKSSEEQEARQYLSALGLSCRIDNVLLDAQTWGEIYTLARKVIECVIFSDPNETGTWLRIDAHMNRPDPDGWITGYQPLLTPFWIRKVDLSRLQALEDRLTPRLR
ncbi:hypothetical protein PEP31012_00643 [Pandoraea eparura]|uniref:Uncharacterized protein n=1 Tax=Pandoraea eparura TaxID=2508291 RepID=A0A5E4S9G0_9BURK|nr:hypothetical protein [Pandoraea eparura]VVD71781.1 hypothetical protein PEP31012_00643 [Pandoraea eparura]